MSGKLITADDIRAMDKSVAEAQYIAAQCDKDSTGCEDGHTGTRIATLAATIYAARIVAQASEPREPASSGIGRVVAADLGCGHRLQRDLSNTTEVGDLVYCPICDIGVRTRVIAVHYEP